MTTELLRRGQLWDFRNTKGSARAWTRVILAGKGGSRRHPTSRFSGNVEVGETSYQMLEGLPFLNGGEGVPSFYKNKRANFSGEK